MQEVVPMIGSQRERKTVVWVVWVVVALVVVVGVVINNKVLTSLFSVSDSVYADPSPVGHLHPGGRETSHRHGLHHLENAPK